TFNRVYDSLPGGGYYIDSGDQVDPTVHGPDDQFVQVIEPQVTTISGDHFSLYVQDVWKPFDNLTIRPGVRFDSARLRNYQDVTQVELNTYIPRIGVSWDPFSDHKTSIHGGYYQYVDTGFLTLSDFAGGKSALKRRFRFNPLTD